MRGSLAAATFRCKMTSRRPPATSGRPSATWRSCARWHPPSVPTDPGCRGHLVGTNRQAGDTTPFPRQTRHGRGLAAAPVCSLVEPLAPVSVGLVAAAAAPGRGRHQAGRTPDRCAKGGARWGFAGAIQRPAVSGRAPPGSRDDYDCSPIRTTSFLWWHGGNHTSSPSARILGVLGAEPRGWLRSPPAGTVRGPRARSSVGERCLHTAEVRGSIPRAPTGTPIATPFRSPEQPQGTGPPVRPRRAVVLCVRWLARGTLG